MKLRDRIAARIDDATLTTVRAASIAVQIIGLMWALIALTYAGRIPEATRDFWIALAVTAVGFAVWLAAEWIEHHR